MKKVVKNHMVLDCILVVMSCLLFYISESALCEIC